MTNVEPFHSNTALQAVADLVEAGGGAADSFFSASGAPPAPAKEDRASQPSQEEWQGEDSGDEDAMPSDIPTDRAIFSPDILSFCAALDQSDTDNGNRLRTYFGDDILVIEEREAAGGQFLVWAGTHWSAASGAALARILAQRIGGLIALEADYMAQTPSEARAIEAGEKADADLRQLLRDLPSKVAEWSPDQVATARALERSIDNGKAAIDALKKRQISRRRFGVSSKNRGRIEAMLDCAAPHLRRAPSSFNADPLIVATETHTLQFTREIDDECPDPDAVRYRWKLNPILGHRRDDLITSIVPVGFDPLATSAKWEAFLDRFLPQADKRRTVQQFCGLGLLGIIIQKLMFHYGEGANGKSVFLETLMRLLGDSLAVSLPPETLIGGGDRNAGGAAPDIIRLFGKRMLRVPEIKPGAPLQEDLIKRITGGEEITARTLFKGYVDFQNKAKPHMSGNGFPKIDGTDHGIWRRMLVVHWTETIAEAEQKDFEEVVTGLLTEAPGILNWLIAGALDYLTNGLFIASDIKIATQEYRDEMDTVGQFFRDCVAEAKGQEVTAREMFNAYKAWCLGNAKTAVFETRFGRTMKTLATRKDDRVRRYVDVALHDVPRITSHGERPPHPADQEIPA
jgi:putative DNA primase/helicase